VHRFPSSGSPLRGRTAEPAYATVGVTVLTPGSVSGSLYVVKRIAICATAAVMLAFAAGTAEGAMPLLYKNCTNLNKRYPHGLGKLLAKDRGASTSVSSTGRRQLSFGWRGLFWRKRP
jgi:sulfite exporter TauE/SafE